MLIPVNGRSRVVVKEIRHREKEKDDSENHSGSCPRNPGPGLRALRRYRLSLLKQPYRNCDCGSRFTPVGTRGVEATRVPGEDSRMTSKGNRNVTLEHGASPIQPHEEDTSANHTPSHEEIRHRAYELYLERGGDPGDGLDDWLRAERELKEKYSQSNDENLKRK